MTAGVGTELDRSIPPLAGDVRSFEFPPFLHTRLANGLDLYLARWPYYPLVSLHLLLPAGGQYSPAGLAGLASLHGALLDEGTERYSALEIASSIERLGGFLGTGADWDTAYLSSTLLVPHLDAGVELLAEMARRPSFPEAEIERAKRHRLADILRAKAQPSLLADRYFSERVYQGTVYAEPLTGTEESVRYLGRAHFVDFNRRHVTPEGAALIAVGDLDPEALARRLEGVFGDWRATPAAPRPHIEPAALDGVRILVVDRPGSSQTQLQLGHGGMARDDPEQPAALLMNAILGGKFTSRLNLNLREKHGVTYSAHSQFVYRQGTGPFLVRLAVATESAAMSVREIRREMERLRGELVSQEELAETRDFLVGVFPTTLQTVSDLARRFETLAIYGLPDDYYVGYPAVLKELSRQDVRRAARRFLHPDRLAVVAVGGAEELRGQLEELGPVEILTP